MIQRPAVGIMIGLDAEVSAVKKDTGPVFEIDGNDMCTEISLAEQVRSMIHPICHPIMLVFEEQYPLIFCRILFQLL